MGQLVRWMLSACVYNPHLTFSTFATIWNQLGCLTDKNGEPLKLSHTHMWRLFIIHHALHFLQAGETLSIPTLGFNVYENAETLIQDQFMVKKALELWTLVLSGHYWTLMLCNVRDHWCTECAHFHQSFLPGEEARDCSQAELMAAHNWMVEDHTQVATAAIIDRIKKLTHKVYY